MLNLFLIEMKASGLNDWFTVCTQSEHTSRTIKYIVDGKVAYTMCKSSVNHKSYKA